MRGYSQDENFISLKKETKAAMALKLKITMTKMANR